MSKVKYYDHDLEAIAGVVHGIQVFGYTLGFMYHYRKHNTIETVICAAAIPYHAWAVLRHLDRAKDGQN